MFHAKPWNMTCSKCARSRPGSRCDLVAYDNGRRPAAREVLVGVLIVFAAGERHDLGRYVGGQLLLAGAAFDDDIILHLVVLEAQELDGNNVCALMQELIEGVLAVGAGLAEDDRAGHIVNRFAEAVDGLAVGLHVELLQVCREAGQSLGIRQDCGAEISFDVALVSTDQGIEQGRILPDIRVLGRASSLRACHDAVKISGPKARDRSRRRHRREEEYLPPMNHPYRRNPDKRCWPGRSLVTASICLGIQACLLQSVPTNISLSAPVWCRTWKQR